MEGGVMSGFAAGEKTARVLCCSSLFFFQAEDGIRDLTVTGVQTCALPISLAISNAVFMDPGSRSPCSRGRDDGCMRQANHRLLRIGTGSSEMGISRTRSSRSYSSLPSALLLKSYMTCMAW